MPFDLKNIKNKIEDTLLPRSKSKPIFTYTLMALMVAVFAYEFYLTVSAGEGALNTLVQNYGFSFQNLAEGKWWTPITAIFLHGDAEHLLFNLIALYFFGKAVEDLGRLKFMIVFFASMFAADAAQAMFGLLGFAPLGVPAIGMSGVIFGFMGAAVMVKPLEFVLYPFIIPIPLIMLATLYTLYNVAALIILALAGVQTSTAYAAHVGGLLAGAYLGIRFEGVKRGFEVVLLAILIALSVPIILEYLKILDLFNYITASASIFKKV